MKKVLALTLSAFTAITLISCANVEENNDFTNIPTETMVTTIPIITTEPNETVAQTIPTEPIIIKEDITFSYEYISEEDVMPYGLFTPSTAKNNKKTPLIVWLHGSGEKNINKIDFPDRGLPYVLNTWTLEGFNAYVLCPHLTGKWNYGDWHNTKSKENIQTLIDKFTNEHNINTDKIIIAGHSLGAQGALYMAHELPDYFSKMVILSGFWTNVDISKITIPSIGYVGMISYGEHESSSNYMHRYFMPTFGQENTFIMQSSHSNLPFIAFNEDKDNNGNSDVIEWMLYN